MRATMLTVLFALVGTCDGTPADTTDASVSIDDAPATGEDGGAARLTWIREGPSSVDFRSAVVTPSANLAGGTSPSPIQTTLYAASTSALCHALAGGEWSSAGSLLQITLVGPATGDGYERLGLGTYPVVGEGVPLAGEAGVLVQAEFGADFVWAVSGNIAVVSADGSGVTVEVDVELEGGSAVRGSVFAPGCAVMPAP